MDAVLIVVIFRFPFAKQRQRILYHTVYKQGITKFFSKELLLSEDRSSVNVTALVTASF